MLGSSGVGAVDTLTVCIVMDRKHVIYFCMGIWELIKRIV